MCKFTIEFFFDDIANFFQILLYLKEIVYFYRKIHMFNFMEN